ncbi:hypothetical protein HMPREF9607_00621 [Cutibacterium modestum HL044PA1]|uniref:Uncharacterized protein n=1 Tax=Cutibacterium modestum HL044PA1 TaxID=765109 RepID=A0ABN0C748_9ACTN|nr:hypothetical protein HMPREF9607_00621 [Cutibacterium modestum HL044PA1]
MEGVHHRDRLGSPSFYTRRIVHCDNLDRVAPWGGTFREPRCECVFRAAVNHVE